MPSHLQRARARDWPAQVANTALLTWGGRHYALAENGLPFEFALSADGEVLSRGFESFAGALSFPFSAHPKVHAPSGELIFHGYSIGARAKKWWGRLRETEGGAGAAAVGSEGAAGAVLAELVELPAEYAAGLMHDLAITEGCALLFDMSITVELDGVFNGNFGHFDGARRARIGVAPLTAAPTGGEAGSTDAAGGATAMASSSSPSAAGVGAEGAESMSAAADIQ
eukprot:2813792-Prymnesium_polylepis.1